MSPRTKSVATLLIGPCLVIALGCGDDPQSPEDDDPVPPADDDTIPPASVDDLRIQSIDGATVTVAWTAPGDDDDVGTADAYDLRWSYAGITAVTWEAATPAADLPAPAVSGTAQSASFDVTGKATVSVALRTADEVPNWSDLSNVATETLDELFVVRQLTTVGGNTEPYVKDGVVVWVRDLGVDGEEIYMFDLDDPTSVITRRTGSGGEKRNPACQSRGYLMWSGRAHPTADWQLHVCNTLDICQLTQHTDDDLDHDHPRPLLGADYVWERSSGFYTQIMIHRAGYVDSPVSDDCCPWPDYTVSGLDAKGDSAVWRSVDAGITEYRAYLWNQFTEVLVDLTDIINAATGVDYSVDAGEVAFSGGIGAEMWVQYWDGSEVHAIEEGRRPSLSEGRVAYDVWAGSDWDVHYWDGTTIHDIAVEQFHEAQACLDGDWLVWVGNPGGGETHLFYTRVRE